MSGTCFMVLPLQAVGIEHLTEFGLDPILGKAEFGEMILMFTFELSLPVGRELEFSVVLFLDWPAEVLVKLADGFPRIPLQITVINAVIMARFQPMAKGEEVFVPLDGQFGIRPRNQTVALNLRRMSLPHRDEKTNVRGQ